MTFSASASRSAAKGKAAHSGSPAWAPGAFGFGSVALEYIWRAKDFRDRLTEAHASYYRASERLIEPFRPRSGAPPRRAPKHLRRLAASWLRLRRFGRLRCIADVNAGVLQICETFLVAGSLSLPGWHEAAAELGVYLILRRIVIAPPHYHEQVVPMAAIGLHAVARRFQRGEPNDAAVIADINPLGLSYPDCVRSAGEFRVAVPGGEWVGTVMLARLDQRPILSVRTYTARPAPGFRFDQVARLVGR